MQSRTESNSNHSPVLPLWRSEYPFASHFQTVHQNIRQHYIDEGPRDASRTILTVHGNPTWSFYYRTIVSQFRDKHRVVAVDHVGCGLSDKPQVYDYCLATHTKNLIQLIDTLDLNPITLVVHDWGGAIGLGAAVERPDRIEQILVLNTGAFPPPYIPLRIAACRWPWVGSFAMRYGNAFARAAITMAISRLKRLPDVARDGLLAPYNSPPNRIAIDRFVHDIPMKSSHRTYQVLEKLESRLPILQNKLIRFVWGMKDWCFRPECMERLQKAWPQATRRELSDVGHYVMEEAPQEVSEELAKLVSIPR